LESVLSSINPLSEDAAFETVNRVITAAVWRSHLVSLDNIAQACGAREMSLGLVRLMGMTSECLIRDHGESGPKKRRSLEGDEPAPCEIDDRARGRIMTHLLNVAPLDGAGVSDDVSDREYRSLFGTIEEEEEEEEEEEGRGVRGEGRALETLGDLPLAGVLSIRKAAGVVRTGSLLRRDSGMVSARSEGPSTARSHASSARTSTQYHPAMAGLFDMADRRNVGWLNVTDLQVVFLEYHGHKQWANPNLIRTTLADLGISKGGNEPVKQHHFLRQDDVRTKDPQMEFAARPLPPDKHAVGVPEQARELAAILKKASSQSHGKPVAARRRLNRALTAQQPLTQHNVATAAASAEKPGAGDGANGPDSSNVWDQSSHQVVSPQVSVRDVVSARRPSTAPASGAGTNSRQQQQQKDRWSKKIISGDGSGTVAKKGLDEFLSLDHTAQASLVETVTDVRPGVTVQEFAEGLMEEPEILRMKAGPAELQVPGRLSRSAYKALSRARTAPELPLALDAERGAIGGGEGRNGFTQPLKSDVARARGGVQSSAAPLGLRGFFGAIDGPDPRLLGGSKASTGYDGDDGGRLEGDDLGKTWSGNVPERDGALPSSSRNGYDERLPPFFVGEDIGNSSLPGGAGQGGGRAHAVIPKGTRPASSASGAARARVSSPGLGVRGERRGGRAVAAW
ncbi:unnamed protein product, partial [Pylaiella littoralis]